MKLTKSIKKQIVNQYSTREDQPNPGLPEVQIHVLTHRIKHLTTHLGQHKKDHATGLGLTKMVSRRKRLLKYLKAQDLSRFQRICSELSLRG